MHENTITAAQRVIVGSCMFALQTLGLDPKLLFWAAVGAAIGVLTMPTERGGVPLPRLPLRDALTLFVAVVLACSLFAAWISGRHMDDNDLNRKGVACASAWGFYIVWRVVVERVPQLLNSIFDAAPPWVMERLNRWFPGNNKP